MQLSLLLKNFLKIGVAKASPPLRRRKKTSSVASDPLLQSIWMKLQAQFFPDRSDLRDYLVVWSPRRQKRVLASVSLKEKKVRVAKELQDPTLTHFLDPLLYHEMCHAVLGEQVGKYKGKNAWHGPQFKKLEQAHPQMESLEKWIKAGGWAKAVRVARGKEIWSKRNK